MNESILVVDDDRDVRKTLSSILSNEGYIVETVESGKQAIKAVEETHFDLALIDIELPDIKGTDLLSKLKKSQPGMVRIIVTGFPSLENAIKAVNEGAHGYVLKPFDGEELLKTIRKHLDEKIADQLRTWVANSQTERKNAVFSEQFKKQKGSQFSS
jgi:DNA-binding NtrC family response regulator